jgi:hypothetical protein
MVTAPWLPMMHAVRPRSAAATLRASSSVPYVAYGATRTEPPNIAT